MENSQNQTRNPSIFEYKKPLFHNSIHSETFLERLKSTRIHVFFNPVSSINHVILAKWRPGGCSKTKKRLPFKTKVLSRNFLFSSGIISPPHRESSKTTEEISSVGRLRVISLLHSQRLITFRTLFAIPCRCYNHKKKTIIFGLPAIPSPSVQKSDELKSWVSSK